jgi:phage tail sheath protein FI
MAVQPTYPGVYIEEFAPGAPIQGVSTSIAAFIGTAIKGDLDKPTKITSWDQFRDKFGEAPAPGSYLWHAVRGFFDNGGQTCYIVRASNGTYAETNLVDRAANANPVVKVQARQPGSSNTPITVQVTSTSLLDPANTNVYQPTGNSTAISGRKVTLTDEFEAAQFRPGDWLDFAGTRAQVVRVSKSDLQLDRELTGPAAQPGAVRMADLAKGDRVLRIMPNNTPLPAGTLVPGSILTIAQNGTSDTQVVDAVQAEYFQSAANTAATTYRVTLRQGLDVPVDMTNPVTVQSQEIGFQVGNSVTYPNLGLDPAHRNYYVEYVNDRDQSVILEPVEPPSAESLPNNLPADTNGPAALQGGTDEDLTTLNDQDYIDAIDTLREVDEVSIIAIPGVVSVPVQQALIAHCELKADRFAVLDSMPGAQPFNDVQNGPVSVENHRKSLDSTRGYAALYYPWLWTISAQTGKEVLVPPSGHVIGIMARVDANRGVHKAPANETVYSAFAVQTTMSDQEQGLLNLQGINVIRVFQTGGRPVLWGARTTATDLNWQYVNVRRLFLYMEESIQEGIRWAVFEPNNLQLWQKLKRTITEFLTRVWRDGALFGEKAEDAFYVRIDEALNPFSEQALGRLHIEVGVRPTYPAEFIIVRIGISPGGSEISEG